MQNFKDYSYTIQIDKLEETARAAASTGCKIYMIINGEFYDATQPETIRNIPVNECSGYRIKINKKSITAADGSRGLFSFIRDCIRNDFMLSYVDGICRQFAPDPKA